jgi:hypothetical protein
MEMVGQLPDRARQAAKPLSRDTVIHISSAQSPAFLFQSNINGPNLLTSLFELKQHMN